MNGFAPQMKGVRSNSKEASRCDGGYADYLREDALRAQADHVAQTWLLREETSGKIIAYMSLIADAVKLSTAEKELHKLDYPFKTIPAMKVGKLAVAEEFRKKYRGIGTLMIYHAGRFAQDFINPYCSSFCPKIAGRKSINGEHLLSALG